MSLIQVITPGYSVDNVFIALQCVLDFSVHEDFGTFYSKPVKKLRNKISVKNKQH
jgi:hypothetical protein